MKKTILPKFFIIIGTLLFTFVAFGCGIFANKEPVNKIDAVYVMKDRIMASGWGSGAANKDNSLTLEEMLQYAIEDEYMKRKRYELICQLFKVESPFYEMSKTETTNILKLIELFSKYNVPVTQDKSLDYIKTPKTLLEGYDLSIKGELNNAAMYDKFLEDSSLNEDVKKVFKELKNISNKQIKVLQKEMEKLNNQ